LNQVLIKDRSHSRGFTLIELMIAMVVMTVLVLIALPSYDRYVIRTKRTSAESVMMQIADRQQQIFIANRSYMDATALTTSGYSPPAEVTANYTWAVTVGTGTVPSFLITFTPIGRQVKDGALTLSSEGVKTPANKW
jgi:type IV pilus assembly protein PilE